MTDETEIDVDEPIPFRISEHEKRRQAFDVIEAELMQAFNRQDGAALVVLMRKMRELLA